MTSDQTRGARGLVPDPDCQRQFWDDWNARYRGPEALSRLDAATLLRQETVLLWMRELALSNPLIMDLGCGTGWLSAQLAGFGRVTGVDIAVASIRKACQRFPDIEFRAGDLGDLDVGLERYDVVVCLETLSHVPDQEAFLTRIREVLKPGGYLIMTTQNRFVFERRSDVFPQGAGQIRRWVTTAELKRLVRGKFVVRRLTTMLPEGHGGILRLVNSTKLNRLLCRAVSAEALARVKERAGLGQTIALLAQR